MKNATSEPALLHLFGQVSCLEEIKKISSSVSLDQGSLMSRKFQISRKKCFSYIHFALASLYNISGFFC